VVWLVDSLDGWDQRMNRLSHYFADDIGTRQHYGVRCPLDLGHHRTHPVVGKAMEVRVDGAVGGGEDTPRRLGAPGRCRCGLAERNGGQWPLRDCHEGGFRFSKIRGERFAKAPRFEKEVGAAVGKRRRREVRAGWRCGKVRLERRQGLTLIGSKAGDVNETDDVVRRARSGDQGSALRVTDKQHGTFGLRDDRFRVLSIAATNSSERIRRRLDPDAIPGELSVEPTPARRIRERTMDKHNRWI
jgi:hypothetical protein